MNTSKIFEKEIGFIQNLTIQDIVKDTLDSAPACIQIISASSTMKYHPAADVIIGEFNKDGTVTTGGLVNHIKTVTGICKCLIETEIFDNTVVMNDIEHKQALKDSALAACILHDCCKPDDTPKHYTKFDHPVLAAKLFKNSAMKYINENNNDYMKLVIPWIYGAIASHMGEWNTATYAKGIILPKPKTPLEEFVHMCDYISSRKFINFDYTKFNEVY